MDDTVRMQRANHRDVIGAVGQVGKQVRHDQSRFTVRSERPLAAKEQGFLCCLLRFHRPERGRYRHAMKLVQEWFGIKGLDLTGTTSHEEENH